MVQLLTLKVMLPEFHQQVQHWFSSMMEISNSGKSTPSTPVMCSTFISKSSCDLYETDSESDSSSDDDMDSNAEENNTETETDVNVVIGNVQYDAHDKEDKVFEIEDEFLKIPASIVDQ